MPVNDDRRENTLPVTSEVGSEGGSFADPTTQVSTFEGDIHRTPGHGGASSSATQAIRRDQVAGTGKEAPSAADGIVRYPTEPPHPPSATQGRRMGGVDWRTAAAGAAAGAAVALAFSSLRQRRHGRDEKGDMDCDATLIVAVAPPES